MSSRLRSSLIDHGSHGDRSSGGLRSFSAHAASHVSSQLRMSMPFIESVPTTEYMIAVNLAPSSLSEPNDSRRPMAGPRNNLSGAIVIQRHLRAVDEHAQPFAMVQQRAQRPALARLVRQADQLPGGLREQAVERLLQRALRRVERPASGA